MSASLHGLIAATHTPFHADGSLNVAAVALQAAQLRANGIAAAFIGGTTGECLSLTLAERLALGQAWSEATRGTNLKVVVHVGSNCLADARTLAAQAESLGAAAISAFAPSYFKPRSLEALIACAGEIAAAAPRTPFYFYDIPSLTGVNLPMPDFLAQAPQQIPTLAGIKFTNSDLMSFQLCLRAGAGRWYIPWGCDEYLLAALALGAQGAVGSTYNFAAPIYQRLLAAFHKGDLATARHEQFHSVQLVQLLSRFGYMAAAKAVMAMLGVPVGPARLPHGNLSAAQLEELRAGLEGLQFFALVAASPSR